MATKIYKYQLETKDLQQIEMPQDAEILCLQTQNDTPCIWALVESNERLIKRTFEIFGTGHNVHQNANRQYIGTYQVMDGNGVFHCFEVL